MNNKMSCPSDPELASMILALEKSWPEWTRVKETYKNDPSLIERYVRTQAYKIFCTSDGFASYMEESMNYMRNELKYSRQTTWNLVFSFTEALFYGKPNKYEKQQLISNLFDVFWPSSSPKVSPQVTPEETSMLTKLYSNILSFISPRATAATAAGPTAPRPSITGPTLRSPPPALTQATLTQGQFTQGPMTQGALTQGTILRSTVSATAGPTTRVTATRNACGFFEFQAAVASCGRHALNHIFGKPIFNIMSKAGGRVEEIYEISNMPSVNEVMRAYPTINTKKLCATFDSIVKDVFFCEEEENYESRFLYYVLGLYGARPIPPIVGTYLEVYEPTYKLFRTVDLSKIFQNAEVKGLSPATSAFDIFQYEVPSITRSQFQYAYKKYKNREGSTIRVPDKDLINQFRTIMLRKREPFALLLNYTDRHYTAAKSDNATGLHCLYDSTHKEGPYAFATREELLDFIIGLQFSETTGTFVRYISIWDIQFSNRPYNVYQELKDLNRILGST
jgi:hypothetical protein